MSFADPIKTVGLCFLNTGCQAEYFLKADDERTLRALAPFLEQLKALVISLDGFSDEDTTLLKESAMRCGGSIFAPPECFGRHNLRRGYICSRACALRPQS